MKNQSKYWEKIFTQYGESGLTRPAFCKQNALSYSKFQYQWYKQHQTDKVIFSRGMNPPEAHSFETISVTTPTIEAISSVTTLELVICLPNQVRCEIRGGLLSAELPALLKQLGAIC